MNRRISGVLTCCLGFLIYAGAASSDKSNQSENAEAHEFSKENTMQLGNFSISLAVKDIEASKAFYDKLDFKEVGGDIKQNWLVLQNGATTIGLFQGMFEENIMTFNPGWNDQKETLKEFDDVRDLGAQLKQRGLSLMNEAGETENGPGSFMIVDPDGNTILIDQHVDRPE